MAEKKLRILALEPYGGLSHMNFLKGWADASAFEWTVVSLPAHHWKWRMRHGAWTMAQQIHERYENGERWDIVFASEMLDLPSFLGMAGQAVAGLPTVLCFHENQLTYPDAHKDERDIHFGLTNLMSAATADLVIFNSEFHRDSFLTASRQMVKKAPGKELSALPDLIEKKVKIAYPGIKAFTKRKGDREWGPLKILWAARWDHDKNAEHFLCALRELQRGGVNFELILLGECFEKRPSVFDTILWEFKKRIIHAGFVADEKAYREFLGRADIVVSTAQQEFFGIAMVEAVNAGCFPLLPDRLAYPEVFDKDNEKSAGFFYDGSWQDLRLKITEAQQRLDATGTVWFEDRDRGHELTSKYYWKTQAPTFDQQLYELLFPGKTMPKPVKKKVVKKVSKKSTASKSTKKVSKKAGKKTVSKKVTKKSTK